jgi:DNA-binding CsgD family transcriptional regulator
VTSDDLTCHLHPDGRVRAFRVDGPLGRTIHRRCEPLNGEPPHLVGEPQTIEVRAAHATSSGPRLRRMPRRQGQEAFGLTRAELDVLRAAAAGLTVLESAALLQKGAETVKTQRNRIILKLGARNMVQAACIAAENGLVTSSATAAVPVAA